MRLLGIKETLGPEVDFIACEELNRISYNSNYNKDMIYDEMEFYSIKIDRLIHLIEYKLGLINFLPINKIKFNKEVAFIGVTYI